MEQDRLQIEIFALSALTNPGLYAFYAQVQVDRAIEKAETPRMDAFVGQACLINQGNLGLDCSGRSI